MTHTLDEHDIARCQAGDFLAFEPLVVRHQRNVFQLLYRIVQQREEAEELAQDVFVKAYHALHDFKGSARFSTWLYRIAYNAAMSHRRKKRIVTFPIDEELLEENADTSFFDSVDLSAHRATLLPEALEQLGAEAQALLTLYYQQDLSIAEVADITGLTESNIKVKLYRARKHLHDYIQDRLTVPYAQFT